MQSFPIFEKLGGEQAALEIVTRALGKEPTKFARDKWRSSGRLPARIALPLIFACTKRDIEVSSDDCLWPQHEAAE